MTIQQLEYVLAVDKTKNFTRAAEICNVTQATLSLMIKKLEDEFGMALFDRKGSPVITTEFGKVLIEEARQIMVHEKKITDFLGQQRGKVTGEFRLSVLPSIASTLIPQILPVLSSQLPHLRLIIEERGYDELQSGLHQGDFDAAILSPARKGMNDDKVVLYYETLMVYGMPKMERKYIMPFELQGQHIWLLEEGNIFRQQCLSYCPVSPEQQNFNLINFQAKSFDTLIQLVDTAGGLTFIPELYYQQLPEDKKEHVKQFSLPIPVREVSLVYHRPYAKSYAIQVLSGIIQSEMHPKMISNSFTRKDLHILE